MNRALIHLGVNQAEAPGQVHVEAHFIELGPVDRRRVDREADDAPRQVVDEQLRRLARDRHLGLNRRGTEVRCDDDIGKLE